MGAFSAIGHLARLGWGGFVLAREGVFATVDPELVPAPGRPVLALAKLVARRGTHEGASRLAVAVARLGPSYVKLGQFLATRPDVVGPNVVRELGSLQDRMAPFGQEVAVAIIEAALEQKLSDVFSEFSQPVAAASIAQVHRARVKGSNKEVAVKVLRPGVERRFRRDLSDMYFAARLAERFIPDVRRLKPVEVVDTLARSVKMEMDFRLEAAAAGEFAENTADDLDFRVPAIDWDLTARDVLVMEWMQGIPLSDIPRLRETGRDLPALGRSVIQSFLRHAMRDGLFHADMHQGNLFMDAEGRLVAVDFGIMGRLGVRERRFLAEILFGFITRDYRRVAQVHFDAGYVPSIHKVEDFAQAIRAIGEPIHSRTADQISMAKLLTLLFEVTGLFDMKTRTELVMLQKTMVVVEGVARTLDPQLNMWATSEPVVRSWIESNLGPAGILKDAAGGLGSFASLLARLPALGERAEALAGQLAIAADKGFGLSPASVEAIGKAEARRARWGNLALWLIAAALLWLAFARR